MHETVSFWVRGMCVATKSKVVRWAVSGERLKILAEVRMIIVAGLVRDLRPVRSLRRVYRAEDVFQPAETGQRFG